MNEKEQRIKQIEKLIRNLPYKAQQAVCWLVKNIETVDQFAQGEELTDQEIERLTEEACEKEDYIMLIMILYKQAKDEEAHEEK
ncbi:hypothetical protein [Anaerovorax odorimutans]|uniref:hypothetical protein n=1 Tax=Anaerovorax odorimutans TaxID=109327 RepID=UPI00041D4F3A|nr:hypothetical protein [Anaerovorax odorimutans]